jgi:hypothetical protein
LKTHIRDWIIATLGFVASLALTLLFIQSFDGYISHSQMMLSGAIAGGKWGIQLLLAAILLEEKRWSYFREMGMVCGIGSCMLIPYILVGGSWAFFLGSLILCVFIMAWLVVSRLAAIGVTRRWVVLWFALLAVAVSLQLTVVFDVI